MVSTHSRPKAAAHSVQFAVQLISGFNTQPPEGGCIENGCQNIRRCMFQHTATRRWLLFRVFNSYLYQYSFNTQPPEGGCTIAQSFNWAVDVSTHSHPKVAAARLPPRLMYSVAVSTHSHPKVAACLQQTDIDF